MSYQLSEKNVFTFFKLFYVWLIKETHLNLYNAFVLIKTVSIRTFGDAEEIRVRLRHMVVNLRNGVREPTPSPMTWGWLLNIFLIQLYE